MDVIGGGIAVGGLVAAGLLVYRLTRWAKALSVLQRRLELLGAGAPVRPVLSRAWGPVGRLARRFDEVAPGLQARIAQLEQDRQQLTAVLGGMAEGVVAVDSRRRLLFANASADRLFGLGAGSVGRLVPELIRSPQVQEAVAATLAGSRPYQGEIILGGRDAGLRGAAARPFGPRHAVARFAGFRRGVCLS